MSAGLSMAEWLMEDGTMSQDSNSSNGRNSDDGGEDDGGGDGNGGGGNGDNEVVASDLDHHTVTISEDVTITSLPLTQLPPIHLQLESESSLSIIYIYNTSKVCAACYAEHFWYKNQGIICNSPNLPLILCKLTFSLFHFPKILWQRKCKITEGFLE